MKNSFIIKMFLFMLIALLLGCYQTRLQSNGEYLSKDKTLSFEISEILIGSKTHEESTNGEKFVEIFDDFGHLYEVNIIKVPSNFKSLPIEAILNDLLENEMNLIKSKIPDATIIKKEFLPQFREGAMLAAVSTPNGSNNIVSENGGAEHRVDSIRYIMFFFEKETAIMATYMFTNSLKNLQKDSRYNIGQADEKDIATLTQFSTSIHYMPKK